MKKLGKEMIIDVQGNMCLVIASLGDITADLPQRNDLAGVKRHSTNKGCCTCNATKDSLMSNNLDLLSISQYYHQTDKQFKEIFMASTITEWKELATQLGMATVGYS